LWPGFDQRTGRKVPPDTDYKQRRDLVEACLDDAPATGKSYLVIGLGSIGVSLVETLIARGDKKVKGFDVSAPKRPLPQGVEIITGSITDYDSLKNAFQGIDVVFTTAAIIRYMERLPWQYATSHAVNVVGTDNVVKACIECGVEFLVQTSSSHVVVDPATVNMSMDENSPTVTATTTVNHYCWTKAQSEKIVIEANGSPLTGGGILRTGALRPCSAIFGPNDGFICEDTMNKGYAIQLSPFAQIDYVFADNVVWGHLLLEKGLLSDPTHIGGQIFGCSNGEPVVMDDFFVSLKFSYDKVTGKAFWSLAFPAGLFLFLGWILETYQRLTHKRIRGVLSNVTPATWNIASLSYGFTNKKAKDMLGYTPLYNLDEGLQKTVEVWNQMRQPQNAAKLGQVARRKSDYQAQSE